MEYSLVNSTSSAKIFLHSNFVTVFIRKVGWQIWTSRKEVILNVMSCSGNR